MSDSAMSDSAMLETLPEISVVIPTHNRCASLLRTLESLVEQSLAPDRFEAIAVLDAVTDGTAGALASRAWPFAFRALVPETRGAAGARNTGARAARGERIVFLDDDMLADPGFLAGHLRAAGADPRSVVVGQSAPVIGAGGWFGDALADWWHEQFRAMADPGHRFSYRDVMSGNLSVPRAEFLALGGFDEALLCREDFELGYRLVQAGLSLRYAADARALHHDASTPKRNLARARAEGRADIQIARKHPAMFFDMKSAGMAFPATGARVLRLLTFRAPWAGQALSRTLGAALPALRVLGMRNRWLLLGGYLRAFAYHAGVATEAGSPAAYDGLAAAARAVTPAPPVIEADLLGDLDALRSKVETEGPQGLRLTCGGKPVAELPALPGAEPIAGRHLDAALRQSLDRWAPARLLAAELAPLPADHPDWIDGLGQSTAADTHSLAELDVEGWSLTPRETTSGYPLRILVRRDRLPLGWITLLSPPQPSQFWAAVRDHVLRDPALCTRALRPAPAPAGRQMPRPPITVVVCTRDRTETLARCLAALAALDYPDRQILVVDNAPTSDATRSLVASLPGIDYVCETRPGLDWARNRGLAEAAHDIIAFTDDDTEVDRHWLTALAETFDDPLVGLVTGLVVPMKLDTPARIYFEDVYGGMGKGFDPFLRPGNATGPRELLWASGFGVGANMAFRRATIARVGNFDPALDVGTATRGGGDIEMFHRAVARGATLAYQPSAFVWHEHRANVGGLHRQLTDNGSGFGAYLLTCARNRTVPRPAILSFALRDWIGGWLVRRMVRPGRHSRGLVAAEATGLLKAYPGYRKAQMRAAELAGEGPEQAPSTK